jgi:hypothetical protein
MLLVHRRDIVETIEIGNGLQIGLGLDQLFGAAMQKADMRIDALDDFTIELQHETQHAVRRWVLRAEVDRKVADVMFSHSAMLRSGGDRWQTEGIARGPIRSKSYSTLLLVPGST